MKPDRCIGSLMTKDVLSVEPTLRVADVLAKLAKRRSACVIVCEGEAPIGVITEREIVGLALARLEGAETAATASDLMARSLKIIQVGDTLDDAVKRAARSQTDHLPVVDASGSLVGTLGRTDILTAHCEALEERVEQRTADLARATTRFEGLSMLDAQLEIGNRRAMEEALAVIQHLTHRHDRPYAVTLCDIDYFKRYNEHYGFGKADDVLKLVAERILETVRESDQVFRYGGEEILVVLPETRLNDAERAAERMCERVRDLGIQHQRSPHELVTISCGVAGSIPGSRDKEWRSLVKRAEAALSSAKQVGRNRVYVDAGEVEAEG
jgi:diguanylate cyclase (GGDEF)-like protein